jgi:hypothetical protein
VRLASPAVVSIALSDWRRIRAERLDRLLDAHIAVGGSRAGRRWATEELNHAILLRLTSEFQGFCRDLHDEAADACARTYAPADPGLQLVAKIPYVRTRRLNRGNAEPGCLDQDFELFGMKLWPRLAERYPTKGDDWRRKLQLLNTARNGIAHDDADKLAQVTAAGWSLNLADIRRWRAALDGLAAGMDHVVRRYLHELLKVAPW